MRGRYELQIELPEFSGCAKIVHVDLTPNVAVRARSPCRPRIVVRLRGLESRVNIVHFQKERYPRIQLDELFQIMVVL